MNSGSFHIKKLFTDRTPASRCCRQQDKPADPSSPPPDNSLDSQVIQVTIVMIQRKLFPRHERILLTKLSVYYNLLIPSSNGDSTCAEDGGALQVGRGEGSSYWSRLGHHQLLCGSYGGQSCQGLSVHSLTLKYLLLILSLRKYYLLILCRLLKMPRVLVLPLPLLHLALMEKNLSECLQRDK